MYVASRSGKFPSLISCMNEKQNSPRAALLIHVLFAIIFSFIGNINQLVKKNFNFKIAVIFIFTYYTIFKKNLI